jgi:hypothetical protein
MKLLGFWNDHSDASATLSLLESHGVPTHTKYSQLSRAGRSRLAIYVCLDSQYPDAVAVLQNPKHRVSNPVNVAEYRRWEADQPLSGSILRWAAILLVAVVVLFGLAVHLSGAQWSLSPNNSSKPTPRRGAA